MPSLFAGLATAASATVDAVFAEGFLLEARDAPEIAGALLANGRPDVDARPVASCRRLSIPFSGVFVAPGAVIHAHGRAMSDATTRPMITDHPLIDIDIGALVQRPKRGDLIHRLDTGERFRVIDPWKSVDFGRAQIWLAADSRDDR